MAEATSREECVDRHRGYTIDMDTPRHMSLLQQARIKQMVAPILKDEIVLDVGCNSGYIVDFIPQAYAVHGVDVAPPLVERAKNRLASAHLAEAEDLPFGDKSVNVVIVAEILEHVYSPLVVLREARRVASRLIVGSTPHPEGKWGPEGSNSHHHHRYHVRCYTEEGLLSDLEAAGFSSPEVRTVDRAGVPQMFTFRAEV